MLIIPQIRDDVSLKLVREACRDKIATKDQFEGAIRACQKVREEMSSEERDMAKCCDGSIR